MEKSLPINTKERMKDEVENIDPAIQLFHPCTLGKHTCTGHTYKDVHSIVYTSQRLETTQIYIHSRMDKLVYSALYNHEMNKLATHDSVNEC